MKIEMKFYHGTTEETWKKIQEEGVLWGFKNTPSRCTYLTDSLKEAKCYGEVILEVEYDPYDSKEDNNYSPGCWQFRVYTPISLENIKKIDYDI